MNLSALIPWPYRLLAAAALVAACIGFGWTKGADHVQDKWDASVIKDSLTTARVQAKQTQATETINHETNRLIARSDDYYRLRIKPVQAYPVPGASGQPDAASEAVALDPAGVEGAPICSPSDGAADALVILGWQALARAMLEATNSPND